MLSCRLLHYPTLPSIIQALCNYSSILQEVFDVTEILLGKKLANLSQIYTFYEFIEQKGYQVEEKKIHNIKKRFSLKMELELNLIYL